MACRKDHPRSRGVYSLPYGVRHTPKGSSPLARGLPASGGAAHGRVRIIPARAGFTRMSRNTVPACEDHPRSRGVYINDVRDGRAHLGSSPLARGLLPAGAGRLSGGGIIPARAGFTSWILIMTGIRRDHPRSRGVYSSPDGCRISGRGSSPLARGLLGGVADRRRNTRIIPARAGFTYIDKWGEIKARDHPRSRGVYDDATETISREDGSSPLARGLQVLKLFIR